MRVFYTLIILILIIAIVGCGNTSTRRDLSTWYKESGIRLASVSAPCVIKLSNGSYRAFYVSGGNIVSAISSDEGITFTAEAVTKLAPLSSSTTEVVITNPWLVRLSESSQTWRMYYEGLSTTESNPIHRIFCAISYDEGNTAFNRETTSITPEVIADNNNIGSPFVIKLPDTRYRMYYASQGFMVKSATSESLNGQTFAKENSAILGSSYDDAALAQSVIRLASGNYKMFYATDWNVHTGGPTKIMSATSSNGTSFTKDGNILIDLGLTVDTKFVTRPSVIQLSVSNNNYRMFYAGTTDGTTYNLFSATKEATGI
ncbi:MAG: hypothetical protein NT099_01350 [Candidatus Saganbacteria bacterium]|nr:hypothetical protein [Candidatus Saganbacteria bacterium]